MTTLSKNPQTNRKSNLSHLLPEAEVEVDEAEEVNNLLDLLLQGELRKLQLEIPGLLRKIKIMKIKVTRKMTKKMNLKHLQKEF